MAKRSTLKASDSERDQVAEQLRQAAAEGRLLAEELEDRLMAAFKARTHGELDQLVSDLPASPVVRRERSAVAHWVPRVFALALAGAVVLAVLAVAVFIITGLLAIWMVWAALGWWLVGRRRHHGCRGGRRVYSARYGTRRA